MKKIPNHNAYLLVCILLFSVVSFAGCISDDSTDESEIPDYEAEATDFIAYLFSGDYQPAWNMFDDDMKTALPLDALQQTIEQIQILYGNYLQNISISSTVEDAYDVVYISSSFSEGGSLVFKIVFGDDALIAGFFVENPTEYIPPSYADPSSFTESNVVIGLVGWELPATLSIPIGNGPFPAVVLVQGSGSSDRDETIGPNKPFKDIAWGLASNGIAVLRYDKRTFVYAQKTLDEIYTFTLEDESIDDTVAAIGFISSLDEIDSERIYVLGHSLGGYASPLIASASGEVDGIISLAGNVRPIEDLVVEQTIYLSEFDGTIDSSESATIASVQAIADMVKTLDIGENEIVLGASKAYWEYLSAYDPIEVALANDLPMLILQGERDYQVTMEDFNLWKQGLGDMATYFSYPSLDHLMFPGTGASNPNSYYVQNNVFEDLIIDIITWINAQN